MARVRAFEQGLLTLVRTKNADILEDIRKTSDLSDATAASSRAWWTATPRRSHDDSSATAALRLPLADEGRRTSARRPAQADRPRMASSQGHAGPHRLDQGDAEDHQGHADGRGLEAAPRAGRRRGGAALCREHGEGAEQHRVVGDRHQFGAEAAGRHRQGQGPSAGRLHRRARPVRRVQLVDRAARAREGECADGPGQEGENPLRRPQGFRPAQAALRKADHRSDRAARVRQIGFEQRREGRREDPRAVRQGRVRRRHAVLLALQVGDLADSDRAPDHPAGVPGEEGRWRDRRPTNTSRTNSTF